MAWKVKLPGPGASSPVVKGERVFVTCFTGMKGPELVRHLLCIERKTGKVLWEQKRPALQPENDYAGQRLQHGFVEAAAHLLQRVQPTQVQGESSRVAPGAQRG